MKYGVINQDGFLVIYDQEKHKQVFRCAFFPTLSEWMLNHPGKYEFKKLDVEITGDDANYL